MPVGEKIHYLIDSTRRAPEFRTPEDMLPALSSFVMMSTVKEEANSGEDPKHIGGHDSFVYTFASIHETEAGMAATQFSEAVAALRKGESVGVTVYVYNQTKDIPVTAIRMSDDEQGVDVLFRWPEAVRQDEVGSLTQ